MPRPKILLVLFDGLRRDMVRPDTAPAIHSFRRDWCDFPNSAAAFPSETRVQASSFVTGAFPAGHGIMANRFYDPALGFDSPMDTSDTARMAAAAATYGELLLREDLGAILHRAGRRYAVLSTGTVGNVLLLNLDAAARGQAVFSIRGPAISSPAARHDAVTARFGPVPEPEFPNVAANDHAVTLLLDHFLAAHRPDLAVLWLNEPDLSYHYRGIGSPESLEAVRGVDRGFARILDWWRAEGRADGWNIVAASDHGQITVAGRVDVTEALRAGGFRVGPAIGPDCDVAVNPGSPVHLRIRDRDPELLRRLTAFLQEQEWCGLLFAHAAAADALPAGTLPMELVNTHNDRAPDLHVGLRTSDGANDHGYPGTCLVDNPGLPIGGGVHGGLHRIELNSLLVMGGDLFRAGAVVETPCGIVDLAPTMLRGLGVAAPAPMDGRCLREGMADGAPAPGFREVTARAEAGGYAQEMTVARIDGSPVNMLRGGRRVA